MRETRRAVLRGVGGTIAGGAILTAAGQSRSRQDTAQEWPQYGADAANTAHTPDNTAPVATVEEQWNFGMGQSVTTECSPTVAGGSVYIGSSDQHLYSFDAETGSQQWRFDAGGEVLGAPAVADGTVYAANENGTVYALKTTDGNKQ
jgi:outer membrane protein assembly factor BamB